jgi:hypothetical protein
MITCTQKASDDSAVDENLIVEHFVFWEVGICH